MVDLPDPALPPKQRAAELVTRLEVYGVEGAEAPWIPGEPWTGPRIRPGSHPRAPQAGDHPEGRCGDEHFTHARGEFTSRRVTPQEVQGRYFVGYCHLRDDERTFRIDRVKDVEIVE